MHWEWRYLDRTGERALASGEESASVCSLAFQMWLEGVDVNELERPDRLAGLLNWQSDLMLREIVGLLNVDELAAVGVTAADDDEWVFDYQGEPLWVQRKRLDAPPGSDDSGADRSRLEEMSFEELWESLEDNASE